MSLFSDLSHLGIDNYSDIEIYPDSDKSVKKAKKKRKTKDADYLFKKNIECPCCSIDFDAFVVRGGKITPLGLDEDLRPLFEEMDPLKYDAVVCPICGYAALFKNFETTIPIQRKKISEAITPYFTGIDQEGYSYTYDDAIIRYKMALLCDVVGFGKNSRRAYTCMKLAWVLRGKLEYERDDLDIRDIKYTEADEYECIEKAYEGFLLAYDAEKFPICGMDEATMEYLLARLAFKLQKYDDSIRYAYKVIGKLNANSKLKDMALDLKYKIREIIPIKDDEDMQ